MTEAQLEKLRHCDFPFESIKEAVGLDDRLRVIWDSEQNGAPDSLELQINKEYAWKCPVCGYRWTRRLGKERDSKGCPACLGKVVIPGWTDLATCNPDIAEEWDYERNGNLTPSDIVSGSAKRVWWKCQKCGGEWQAPPVKRKIGKGSCPYCAGRKLKKGVNDLASQYPEVALDYLPELNGGIPADERFRPTVKTEWPHASAINGIYPEDVADLPTIETAIPRLREIFAGADEVIGYNVGFDLGFLAAVGVRPREDARITDTMNLFKWFMGKRKRYKLVDAADHIEYEWTGRAHGSLADALATLAVQRWLEQWLVAE